MAGEQQSVPCQGRAQTIDCGHIKTLKSRFIDDLKHLLFFCKGSLPWRWQIQLRQGEKSIGLGIRWPGFKLNPPLNSYDLGRVISTSQLSSCVTGEYSLLHSLVVFRNEAMTVKAPGGKEERRERRRGGGGAGFSRGEAPSPKTQNRVRLRGLRVEQQLWGWTWETMKRETDRTRWQLGL